MSQRADMSQTLSLLPVACLVILSGCQQPTDSNSAVQPAALPVTETSKDFGDYVVHFNALSTDLLAADVARQYGIVRSRNRGMLTVSILRKQEGALDTPVTGSVSASAINLTGQLKGVPLREIREGDAVYYIGEVVVADAETLIFTIDVTPMNESSRFSVRYKKQFFAD